jgi:hypothetical protein
MVLARDRRTEQRKDAVTERLRHVALVAIHGVHHQLQRGVDDLACEVGVHAVEQRHRALDVGEQHGDDLALVGVLGQMRGMAEAETLGQVFGHTRQRCGGRCSRRGRFGLHRSARRIGGRGRGDRRQSGGARRGSHQTRPALAAELARGCVRAPAAGADQLEPRAAFLAERGVGQVLTLALATAHGQLRALATAGAGMRQCALPQSPRS